jgi:hypothetical protein
MKSLNSCALAFPPTRNFAQNGAATRRIIGHVSDTRVVAVFYRLEGWILEPGGGEGTSTILIGTEVLPSIRSLDVPLP